MVQHKYGKNRRDIPEERKGRNDVPSGSLGRDKLFPELVTEAHLETETQKVRADKACVE